MAEVIKISIFLFLFSTSLFSYNNQLVLYTDWLMFRNNGKPIVGGYITDKLKKIDKTHYYQIIITQKKLQEIYEFNNDMLVRKNYFKNNILIRFVEINTNGKKIECNVYYKKNNVINKCSDNNKILFVYDNLGNLLKQVYYSNSNIIKQVKIYNNKHLCVEYDKYKKKSYKCIPYLESKPITVLDTNLKTKPLWTESP